MSAIYTSGAVAYILLKLHCSMAMHAPRDATWNARFAVTSGTRGYARLAYASLLVFAGYYLGARAGFALTFLPNPISVLWPPNAILFAAFVLVSPSAWPAFIGAAFVAHVLSELQAGVPPYMVAGWFISNVAEAAIGALIMRRVLQRPPAFATLREVCIFLIAGIAAAFLSSFLDSAFVTLVGWGDSSYWTLWRTRFFSNVLASVTIVPVIVTLTNDGVSWWNTKVRPRRPEAAVLLFLLLLATILIFDSKVGASSPVALTFLPLPLLFWAALRFGPAGASLAFMIVVGVVILGAGYGLGSFAVGSSPDNAVSAQLFLTFAAPSVLALAALLEERSSAEKSLRTSEQRLQLVLDATQDAIYDRDIASDRIWWNRGGLSQFGYAAGQACIDYASWTALLHPEDRPRIVSQIDAAVRADVSSLESDYRLRRLDGSYAHVHEHSLVVRDSTGNAVRIVGALCDVTEYRHAEELTHRLAQASRLTAIGELTASIAHEINQPVSAILSNVDAAEIVLDSETIPLDELRQIITAIRSDDLRVDEVVRHVRGLATKREMEILPFDVNELAGGVIRLMTPTAQRRRIRLVFETETLPRVHGDHIHVQQVLLNLLINAMDAMGDVPPHDRVLLLRTQSANEGFVRISVSDRGHGIPQEDLGRIFDAFYTTKAEGMGLGLAITRTLVDAHGGKVWAVNNPEGGATFHFTLPTFVPDKQQHSV